MDINYYSMWNDEPERITEDTIDNHPLVGATKEKFLWLNELENPRFTTLKLEENNDGQYSFDGELDISELLCYSYTSAGLHSAGVLRVFRECPLNHSTAANRSKFLSLGNRVNTTRNKYSQYSNISHVSLDIDSMVPLLSWDDKMTSQLQYNSTGCNLNKHKETKPRSVPVFQLKGVFNQHKRKEIALHHVLFTIMFLGLLFDIWSQSSLMHKQLVSVSIWPSLLGLFGFMAFVWAVAIMILVGAPFTRMHRAMLISWAIFMLLNSANSITASYVPMLGIFFMGWLARGKATTK
ncbi:putative transmembrane protein [Sesbania bispinosa]|nr:putative transmembrane protein [Sesbania bispinosa]